MCDEEVLKYFLYDGKSKEKNYQKKILSLDISSCIYKYLTNRYLDSESIDETICRIYNNIEVRPVCMHCGGKLKFTGVLKKPFYKFCCQDCQRKSKNKQEITIENNLKKYGVESTFQLESVKDKIKKTNIERYGTEYSSSSDTVKTKIKKTHIRKYGVSHYNNYQKISKTKEEKYNDKYYNNKEKYKKTCIEKYGVDSVFKNSDIREKIKTVLLEKYDVDSPFKSEFIRDKAKETFIEKYGIDTLFKLPEIQEKIKHTFIKKYGVDNPFKSDVIKEKIINTFIDKYGVDNPFKSKEIQDKIKETYKEKYGVEYFTQTDVFKEMMSIIMSSDIVQNKINTTKKQNKSFNISKPEEEVYNILKEKYPDIIRQYRSEAYPFNCDFYIPSTDTYIEYQGSWTHGGHPFDSTNKEDIDKVNLWKIKNTKYYDNAIKTWTIRDVNKRNIAKENKLNYIEIWNINDIKR